MKNVCQSVYGRKKEEEERNMLETLTQIPLDCAADSVTNQP
jgi:hypothetical protein